jgi:predicted alpha/beta superfamily hydrolase
VWRYKAISILVLLETGVGSAQERFLQQDIPSRFLGSARTVRIFLPHSYHQEAGRRFPVLYFHDGQNLFSTAGTNVAFGWGNWEMDKTTDSLSGAGKMQEVILVAIDNSPARYGEYCGTTHPAGSSIRTPFDNYCAFLIEELKPGIDAKYRTRPEAANTGVMGASLGGICSLVLAWEHPEVFGLAGSISGSFMVEHTNFLNHVLNPYQAKPKPFRVYLDSGVIDFTGGDDGRALTGAVAAELRRIGWTDQLMHYLDAKPLTLQELEKTGLRRDKWPEAQTSQHNEFYWRRRVGRALTFLFPPAAR